jgi:hypothetical protein
VGTEAATSFCTQGISLAGIRPSSPPGEVQRSWQGSPHQKCAACTWCQPQAWPLPPSAQSSPLSTSVLPLPLCPMPGPTAS